MLSLDVESLDGAVAMPTQSWNNGWPVSHHRTQETWEDGQAGAGAMPSSAQDTACWGTRETSSLTKCALKTVFVLFQFLTSPSPCLPPPLPPPQTPNLRPKLVKKAFETVSMLPSGYLRDELWCVPPAGWITGTHPRRI